MQKELAVVEKVFLYRFEKSIKFLLSSYTIDGGLSNSTRSNISLDGFWYLTFSCELIDKRNKEKKKIDSFFMFYFD